MHTLIFFILHARCVVCRVVCRDVLVGLAEESCDAAGGGWCERAWAPQGGSGDSAGRGAGALRAGPGRAALPRRVGGSRGRYPATGARWEEAGGAEEEEEGARRGCGAYQPVLDYGAARRGLTRRPLSLPASLPAG